MKIMGEDMLRAAEEAIERNNSSVRNNNYNSEYSVYASRLFKKIKDALEFLNTHDIYSNDVVSLIKHGRTKYELIFFDRIKTEKYSIVDEKWIEGNPPILKESEEAFSVGVRQIASANFDHYVLFKSNCNDGYKHVYVLRQELEWMSGVKINTDIKRTNNYLAPEKCVVDNGKGSKIVLEVKDKEKK